MDKKNLVKYMTLLYKEESYLLKSLREENDWDLYGLNKINSVFKSVPFWDDEFILALYSSNSENLEEGTLTEENIIIPEQKEYLVEYSLDETLYNRNYYEIKVEAYNWDRARAFVKSADFDHWDGNTVDSDTLDSNWDNFKVDNVSEVSKKITESKTEENPYGECNFSAKEFINCVQNHSDLETLYMMKSILDEEIERFEKMISIAQNLDREPLGFKINKS